MIGKRLKQARILARKTQRQLADELREHGVKTSAQAISRYERGVSNADAAFIMGACNALNVDAAYLTHRNRRKVNWIAYRGSSCMRQIDQARVEAFAGDRVELHLDLREALQLDGYPELTRVPVAALDDAEVAAEALRESWQVGERPLHNLVQIAEDNGVIIVDYEDACAGFDGLSGWCNGAPIAVMNSTYPNDRVRLTLAHEIGHLVMDTGHASQEEEEELAFRFAAALLIPARHARRELGAKRTDIGWGELGTLKRKYGVSMVAWARRAHELGIVSDARYREMRKEIRRQGWVTLEPPEFDYVTDEMPLELGRMAELATSKGLISPDRLAIVGLEAWLPPSEPEMGHLTVYHLLAMSKVEREAAMKRAYELANQIDDYEIFEAYEIYDDFDEEYDAQPA